jgi:hypothetical protein
LKKAGSYEEEVRDALEIRREMTKMAENKPSKSLQDDEIETQTEGYENLEGQEVSPEA